MDCPTSGPSVSIPDEEWERVWPQLRAYAHAKYPRFQWKTGCDLDGIVSTAMVGTMEGDPRYPPIDETTGLAKTDVKLLDFLCVVVDKLVRAHRSTAYRFCEFDERLQIRELAGLRRTFLPKQPTVEDLARYNEIIKAMLDLVRGDSEADQIVQVWSTQPELKPCEVAGILGITMEQMRNAQKRIKRRLKKLRRFL